MVACLDGSDGCLFGMVQMVARLGWFRWLPGLDGSDVSDGCLVGMVQMVAWGGMVQMVAWFGWF